MAEMVGVLAVHMFIEKHRKLRTKSRTELIKKSAFSRIPSYRYRFRRRSSCRSSEPASRDASPMGKSGYTGPAAADISMYTLSRDPSKAAMGALLNSEREFLQAHNSNAKDFKDAANRRTTPVWESLSTEEVSRPRRYNHRLELDPSRKKKNSLEACRAITLFL